MPFFRLTKIDKSLEELTWTLVNDFGGCKDSQNILENIEKLIWGLGRLRDQDDESAFN